MMPASSLSAVLSLAVGGFAAFAWIGLLWLPSQPHRLRERIEPDPGRDPGLGSSDVTVLIPARNEAAMIGRTLAGLSRQGPGLRVVVVDDGSDDGTADIVAATSRVLGLRAVEVLQASPLPAGWSGKLWALQCGLERIATRYTLLLDADIELAPGMVSALREQARRRPASLVSVMAKLRCEAGWERLLVPAFVFFFKLIYPFARVNDRRTATAAAAGGCVLIETAALGRAGAFSGFRDALIDDCTLAMRVKAAGMPIWLGVSDAVRSHRSYARLPDFWRMVSRTAFTQLGYSTPRLLATTVLLAALFVGPPSLIVIGGPAAAAAGLALLAMALAYRPLVRFYRLPLPWIATLPCAAVLYVMMTWSSAIDYWRGSRATWKQRRYESAR